MEFYVKEARGKYRVASEQEIKESALVSLQEKVKSDGVVFGAPDVVSGFICLKMGDLPHEVFGVIFMDSQNKMIEYKEMFRGTISQTSVYPREVAKEGLLLNAATVILAHNHPSGNLQPSSADLNLTRKLKETLDLVDIRILDHFIVAGSQYLSMAEKGLM